MLTKYIRYFAKPQLFQPRFNSDFSFDNYKDVDWSERGVFKGLHSMNKVRIPWILDGLGIAHSDERPDLLKKIKILDVGCGAGILTTALASLGADITGIDGCSRAIEIASNRAKSKIPPLLGANIRFINSTPDEFEFMSDERFDAVVASEVLEHVENVAQFVFNCVNLTKPGGMLYFTTVNKTVPSLLFAKYFVEYVARILPKGTHSWKMFVKPEDLEKYLLSCFIHFNLDCVTDIKKIGLFLNPFTNTWSMYPYCGISYAMRGRRLDEKPVYFPD